MSNEKSAKGALPDETLNYIVLDCLVNWWIWEKGALWAE
jgi:hypothetical protein